MTVAMNNLDELHSQFIALWRIHIAVVVAQVIGGVVIWKLARSDSVFLNLWLGAAIASLPGLLCGIAWERAHSDRWKRTARTFRYLYIACASLMTFVAAPLTVVVQKVFDLGVTR